MYQKPPAPSIFCAPQPLKKLEQTRALKKFFRANQTRANIILFDFRAEQPKFILGLKQSKPEHTIPNMLPEYTLQNEIADKVSR